MDYFLLVMIQLIGIGYNVMQTITNLDKQFQDFNKNQIFALFWKEDWDSLIVSGLVLVTHFTFHFVSDYYQFSYVKWEYYLITEFGAALILGYAGQRIAYKVLGTAEKKLNERIDQAGK